MRVRENVAVRIGVMIGVMNRFILRDDLVNGWVHKLPTVADAGHATVASSVEAKLVKGRLEVGLSEITSHDAGSRREGSLDVRKNLGGLQHS